jgi:pimeloyl-ACP methyl ester carboxylesterase
MPAAQVNGVQIAYEVRGDADAPAVLLAMGLGMPAAMWPDEFVRALLDRGFRVVTFDNRDSGASTRLAGLPVPNIPVAMTRALLGLHVKALTRSPTWQSMRRACSTRLASTVRTSWAFRWGA